MTTPTIEEMVETYEMTWGPAFASAMDGPRDEAPNHVAVRTALLAVIEKHFGQALVEAHLAGRASYQAGRPISDSGEYADRTLAQLKAKPHE